jgi:alkylation response protein AidB-like acyl-CoA dehydrogenase
VQLAWGPEEEAFRAELVAFLDEHVPPEAARGFDYADAGEREEGDLIPAWARDWQATLFDHGWMIPAYPPELGGRDCTPVQTLIYLEEMARRRVPRSFHFPGYAIVAPSLLEFGSGEQKELVPAAIRGDTIWCIGMSEPNAGSDLAGLSTRAEVHDDHFVVNGQKVWTSYAMVAQKCFCYVRTDPSAPKHKGISLLITQGSLAHERAGLWVEGVSRLETTIQGLVELARRRGLIDDPMVRRPLAELYERAASLRALGYKGFSSFAQGSSAPEHSFMKMATSELGKECWEFGMELQGAYGAVADPDRGEEHGRWIMGFFMSFANTIAGGSSEIQRNIIAQRVLGLPRAR